jgi:uncharacterized membrane protein
VIADEAVEENNAAWFVLRIIRDKIRVLQVAGEPTWDVRALRGMLKQDPNVDLISFFILRTQDDISQAHNSELSLIPFPTSNLFRNELPSFDLVVLQNFNYRPYGIGQYLDDIRAYVEGGGGLMMLGGPLSFASGEYTATPVAEALPVDLPPSRAPPSQLLDTQEFQPQLTDLGRIHPVTALRYEESDNLRVWRSLPPLEGVNIVSGAKRRASVLATHPRLKTKTGPMPVIVAGNYGEGRSLAVTTDSLWRWGFIDAAKSEKDGRHYLKFWDNAIRWLIQDPDLRYLHVDSDRVAYEPGQSARISIRLLSHDYTPTTGGSVELTIREGFDPTKSSEILQTALTTDERGQASVNLPNLKAGVYRAVAKATVEGRKIEAQDIFLVHRVTAEHRIPAAEDGVLKLIADTSDGRFLPEASELPENLAFTAPQVVRVDRRSDVALWSQPWLLAFGLLFLGLEWLLRQRSGNL